MPSNRITRLRRDVKPFAVNNPSVGRFTSVVPVSALAAELMPSVRSARQAGFTYCTEDPDPGAWYTWNGRAIMEPRTNRRDVDSPSSMSPRVSFDVTGDDDLN